MSAPKVGSIVTSNAAFAGAVIISVDGPSPIQKNYWRVTVRTTKGTIAQITVKA